MIKLNSKLQTLEHSNYPAMTSEPSYGDSHITELRYTRDIHCKGFNGRTGVGIQNEEGYPLSQEEVEGYVLHISPDTFRATELPDGYTITFQQHPEDIKELVVINENWCIPEEKDNCPVIDKFCTCNSQGTLSVSEFNRMLDERIAEEKEAKVQNLIQELFLEEDEIVLEYNIGYLEAFDLLLERAREWWFTLTTHEGYKAKVGALLGRDSIIGIVDMVRMYINDGDYDGIREEKVQICEEEISALDNMIRESKIKDQFNAMFSNQMKYTLPLQREKLGKKIIKWAQSL